MSSLTSRSSVGSYGLSSLTSGSSSEPSHYSSRRPRTAHADSQREGYPSSLSSLTYSSPSYTTPTASSTARTSSASLTRSNSLTTMDTLTSTSESTSAPSDNTRMTTLTQPTLTVKETHSRVNKLFELAKVTQGQQYSSSRLAYIPLEILRTTAEDKPAKNLLQPGKVTTNGEKMECYGMKEMKLEERIIAINGSFLYHLCDDCH